MSGSAMLASTPLRQTLPSKAKAQFRSIIGRLLMQPVIGRLAARLFDHRIPHHNLTIQTSSRLVSDRVRASLLLGGYESAEYRFVKRHIPADASVIELGASMGVMACHLRRRVAPPHRVIAVEADSLLFGLIEATLDAKHFRPSQTSQQDNRLFGRHSYRFLIW